MTTYIKRITINGENAAITMTADEQKVRVALLDNDGQLIEQFSGLTIESALRQVDQLAALSVMPLRSAQNLREALGEIMLARPDFVVSHASLPLTMDGVTGVVLGLPRWNYQHHRREG